MFFLPLVWPEHLEPGNFRVQKYSQDVADRITTHNISLSAEEQITMRGTSSHNQLLKKIQSNMSVLREGDGGRRDSGWGRALGHW